MKKRLLLIALSIFTVASAASAGEYYVNAASGSNTTGNGSQGNPWKTITYALDQISTTGHIVNVAPGTYNVSLGEIFPILLKNGVSIVGSNANLCVLDAGGANTVIRCVGIVDASTIIDGLTLKGGGSVTQGGGLYISGGSVLTVKNCRITGNMSASDVEYGGGIYITNASPVILNDTISSNKSGAIYIDNGSPLVKGNIIINNQGSHVSGIFITGASSIPRITGNVLAKNTSASSFIYAINCASSSHPRIVNNTISDNGGGVFVDNASPDSIENNIICYNTNFGIVENSSSSDPGRVAYNLFFQNGSGLYHDEGATDYFTVSSLNGTVPECSANLEGDPKFVDKTNADYHLRVGSAAFDAGNPNSLFNDPEGTRGDIGALYLDAPPTPPTNVTATRGNAQVQLVWRVNSEPDVLRYRVYYGISAVPTAKMDSTSSKTDTSRTYVLLNNTTYYFRVTAVDVAGNESGYSSEVSATPVAAEGGEYLPDASTVLLLHMNETGGSVVSDASNNAYSGTATGTVIVNGRFGYTRSFNGTGDVVYTNYNGNFGTGPYTVEFWVYLTSFSAFHQNIIGNRFPQSGETWWIGIFDDGRINEDGGSGARTSRSGEVTPGAWYHIAVTRDASNAVLIYKNGAVVDGGLQSGNFIDGTNVSIGGIYGGGEHTHGLIDEIRISSVARSPSEFNILLPPKNLLASAIGTTVSLTWQNGGGLAPLMRYRIYRGTDSTNVSLVDSTTQLSRTNSGLANGTRYFYRIAAVDSSGYEYPKSCAAHAVTAPTLGEYVSDANTVLLLHMNEVAGSSVTDASASNNNGSANGTTVVNGRFGKSRSYTSGGDQINIPNASSLNFGTGSFTLEAWINTQGYTIEGAHPFHKRGSPNNRGWWTSINSDGTLGGNISNVSDQTGSGYGGRIKINDGKWHHIALVVTQTLITGYVDGVLDNVSTVWTAGSPDNDGTLNIGSSWNNFRGLVDEIRISNKARTPDEFNLQLAPKNCTASASGSSITLNWQQGGGLAPLMKYRIYRGTDSVNVTLLDSAATTSYQDLNATAGTFYFYRIAAVDSTGFESAKSISLYSEIPLTGEYKVDTSTVFLMHLNQTGGINVGDVGRNGYHGQFNGGSFVSGRFGNAFQPTSSAGIWTQNFSVVGMENQFTVEAWIKLTSQPTCGGCCFLCLPWMNFSMGTDANFWFNLTLADNSGRGLGSGNATLTVGKWQHLAYVFDSGKASIFLNGILVSTDSYGQSVRTGSGGFNIVNYNAPDVFPGLIDEVRVSKIARKPSEFGLQLPPSSVTASQAGSSVHLQWSNGGGGVGCMTYRIYRGTDSVNVSIIDSTTNTFYDDPKATVGTSYIYRVAAVDSTGFEGAMSRALGFSIPLAGEYQIDSTTVFLMHMNQTGGTVVTDAGPNGYHGQTNAGSFVVGRFGAAYKSGSYDGLRVPNFSSVGLENNVTMEVWVKFENRPLAYANIVSIAGIGINTNQDCWLSFDFSLADGSAHSVSTQSNTITVGRWYHIAGVFKNGVASLYVNGVCRITQSLGQSLRTGWGGGVIGYSNDQKIFTGLIDEVRISSVVRVPSEYGLQLPPKNVLVTRNNSIVHLQWQNGGGKVPCMRYKIYRGSDSLNTALIDSTNGLSYDDQNVSAGNFYCYKVSAVDSIGFENNEGQTVFTAIPLVGEYRPDTSTVLLMHFNQPGATIVNDVSGHGYHGQISGGSFVDGRFGKAFESSSLCPINVPTVPSIGLENSFTIEAWVKLNAIPQCWCEIVNIPWISMSVNSDLSANMGCSLVDGTGGGVGTPSSVLTVGNWCHLAAVFDNGTSKIYVNGILKGSQSYGLSMQTTTGGGNMLNYHCSGYFPGAIDEVRISKVARQPSEFGFQMPPKNLTVTNTKSAIRISWQNGGGGVSLMRYRIYRGPDSLNVTLLDSVTALTYDDNLAVAGRLYCYRISAVDSSGFQISKGNSVYAMIPLVGEYATDTATVLLMHLDQDSGTVAGDISSNGYHGRLTSGSFVNGRFGKAYQPAISNGIYLPNIPTTGLETQQTLEAWIKLNKTPDDWSEIFGLPYMNFGVNTDLSISGGFTLADGSGQGIGTSSNTLTIGKWHHLARTYENGVAKIYVDGVLCSMRSYGQSLRMGGGGGSLATSNNNNVFPGCIDEVRVSRVARQPAQFGLQLQPKGLTSVNSGPNVLLSWENGGGGVPCMRYRIYRGADSVTVAVIDSTVSLTYDDTKAETGKLYFYRVASVDSTGFEGPQSAAVHTTVRVKGEYASDTSTVLLMHMDQSGGLGVFDESPNNFHGQMSSGSFVPGRFGNAFQPGNSDGMWFNTISTVGMENQFTIEMWVKFTDLNKWGSRVINIPSMWTNINSDFSYNLNFSLADGSGAGAWSPSFALSVGKWYHIAGVFDHGYTKLYLNGVALDSRYYDQSVRTSPGGGNIANYKYPDVFPGIVDEVRISRIARKAEEFNLQLPPNRLIATPTPNSVDLSWENGGGAIGCLRYKVYRGVDSLNLLPLDSTITPSYSDTNATVGTLYFYRVTAVDSTGFEGARSLAAKAAMNSLGEYQPDSSTVLLYHFNGTSATTEFDAGKFENHGRLDRTTSAVGRFGKARQFDNQSYINLNYSNSLNIGDADFTLEAWVKAGLQTNWICLMRKWDSNHGIQFYLNGSTGTPAIQLQDESGTQCTVTGGTTLYDSKWHHIAAIRKSNALSLCVDGATEGTADVSSIGSVQGMGGLSLQSGTYLLDEMRISNRARSPQEFDMQLPPKNLQVAKSGNGVKLTWESTGGIVPLLRHRIYRGFDPSSLSLLDSTTSLSYQDGNLQAGAKYYFRVAAVDSTRFESAKSSAASIISSLALGEYAADANTVMLLHMDELTGKYTGDASSSNNNGRVTGSTVTQGKFGNGRLLGSSDGVYVSSTASLNVGSGDFAIETWLKSPSLSTQPMLFYKWSGNESGPGMKLFVNMTAPDGKIVFTVHDGSGGAKSAISSSSVTDNKWHHVAAMRQSAAVKLYIDGVLEATTSIAGEGSFANSSDLDIGTGFSSAVLDEVRISTKARTPQEFNLQLRPTNLAASIAATSITLLWQNGGGSAPLMRYRIYRGADSTSLTLVDSTISLMYTNAGLETGTKYYYRVAAVDSTGFESVRSSAVSGTTQSIPLSPSNVTASAISSSRIDVSWTDNSNNEDGFKIDRKTGSTGSYAQLGTVGANVKTYQDTGLAPTTEYFYRVTAYNAAGTSSPSTETSVTTPAAPDVTAPGPPIAPAITPSVWISGHTYAISWTNPLDSSGIAKVWYRYDHPPTSDTLGTGLAFTITSGVASVQVPAPATCGAHMLYFYLEDGAKPTGNKNPGSCVAVTVKHDDMCPTIYHDSLAVASFSTSAPKDINISATASDAHSGLKSLVLYYRKAGQSWSAARTLSYPAGGGNAAIPASDIASFSNEGVDYRIVALDTADNCSMSPTHSLVIQHTETFTRQDASGNPVTQMSVTQLPSGVSSQMAYRMFSVPLQLNNKTPRRVLEVESGLGSYNDVEWRFFRLNASDGYDEYPTFADEDAVEPGRAFFLILNSSKVPKAGSGTIVKSEDFNKSGIQLKAGFNFVGNPFNFDVPVDSLGVSTNEVLNNRWEFVGVDGTNNGWSPTPMVLKAWNGILLKLNSAAILRFNIADRSKGSAAQNPIALKRSSSKGQSSGARPWTLRINATRGDNGMKDTENLFGVNEQATDSLDLLDLCEPPMIGDKGLSLYSVSNGEALTHDFREPGADGYVWDLIVKTPDRAAKIFLTVDGLDDISTDAFLVDIDSKIVYRPKTSEKIEVNSGNGGRHFRLIIGDIEFAENNSLGVDVVPKKFVMYQNYPNPFNPETMIRYTIPNSDKRYRVSVKVYNLLGNEIVTLLEREQGAGYYEVKFDARAQSSGTYFCRIHIDGGSQASSFTDVKKLILIK
jgi:fibronectin type 3 domain-containing protein